MDKPHLFSWQIFDDCLAQVQAVHEDGHAQTGKLLLQVLQQALRRVDLAVLLVVFPAGVLYELRQQREAQPPRRDYGGLERHVHVFRPAVLVRPVGGPFQRGTRRVPVDAVDGDQEARAAVPSATLERSPYTRLSRRSWPNMRGGMEARFSLLHLSR